ncbi:MAG: oligosaccharide flippase family protein, partial [Candidatus Micrarchaeaceae archaeon]
MRRLLRRGASGSFIVQAIGAGLALVSHVVIARILGKNDYGAYALTLSWVGLLTIFALSGQQLGVVRSLPAYFEKGEWGKARGLRYSSRLMVLAVSMIIAVVGAFVVYQLRARLGPTLELSMLAGFILLPVFAQLQLNGGLHQAMKRAVSNGFFTGLLRPVLLLGFVLLISVGLRQHLDAPLVVLLSVVATVAALIVSEWRLSRAWPRAAKSAPPQYEFRTWVVIGGILFLADAIGMALNSVDVLILGGMLGDTQVGPYYAAVQLSTVPKFWLNAMFVILAPMIVESYSAGKFDALASLLRRSALTLFIVTAILCVCTALVGYWVLGLFGPGFEVAYVPLLIILAGRLVVGTIGLATCLVSMTKLLKKVPILFGFGAV